MKRFSLTKVVLLTLLLAVTGGSLSAESRMETPVTEESPLEKGLAGTPLQKEKEGLRFSEPYHPEFSQAVNNRYQVRFSNGTTAVYTLEPVLQEKMKKYFRDHHVPYGVFVAMDPYSGSVLALVEYSAYRPGIKGLSVKASYPAASLFKLVTAAAAIEEKKAGPETQISFHGGLYRLRKGNWEDNPVRDFKTISLGDALAKSANVPFAKVANRWLDDSTLLFYSKAFGFNQPISFEIPVQVSHAYIPPDKKQIAYTAAGFGDIEMSPLHGAMIASAIGNGGDLLVPHLIEKIVDPDGNELFSQKKEVIGQAVSKSTTDLLKEMMGKTVMMGTSRRAFRSYHRLQELRDITIGGKTGSLTGKDPPGEYSWFVGIAPLEKPDVAVAALVINRGHWRIKGSDAAREGFSLFFRRF